MKQSALPTCVSRHSLPCVCSITMQPPDEKEGDQPAALCLRVRSGVQRLLRRELHLDQVGLGRLRLRQRDRQHAEVVGRLDLFGIDRGDRKSTRLNSSHSSISYAAFCLKRIM